MQPRDFSDWPERNEQNRAAPTSDRTQQGRDSASADPYYLLAKLLDAGYERQTMAAKGGKDPSYPVPPRPNANAYPPGYGPDAGVYPPPFPGTASAAGAYSTAPAPYSTSSDSAGYSNYMWNEGYQEGYKRGYAECSRNLAEAFAGMLHPGTGRTSTSDGEGSSNSVGGLSPPHPGSSMTADDLARFVDFIKVRSQGGGAENSPDLADRDWQQQQGEHAELVNFRKNEQLRKTKICLLHEAGRCKHGSRCRFAHSLSELRPKPMLAKTSWCRSFVRTGYCSYGTNCTYCHSRSEFRDTLSLGHNTHCVYFHQPRGCKMGASCPFVHDPSFTLDEVKNMKLTGFMEADGRENLSDDLGKGVKPGGEMECFPVGKGQASASAEHEPTTTTTNKNLPEPASASSSSSAHR